MGVIFGVGGFFVSPAMKRIKAGWGVPRYGELKRKRG
jgi:hypothetical protein